jgi:integrase
MRKRTKDRHLPPCVYWKHGAYWLVRKGKWTRLGAELPAAMAAYAVAIQPQQDNMPALITKALPAVLKGLAPSTVAQYTRCATLLSTALIEFRPEQVTHGIIVKLLDGFADRQAIANRMLTVLRMVFRWALDRELVASDPTISVKRFTQTARDRLIEPAEYQAIYGQAAPWLQVVMDLCYLTGQRIGDVLTIERAHLRDEGIYFRQQKTDKQLVVAWSPQLRAVIARARTLDDGARSTVYVLSTRRGSPRLHANVWRAFKAAAKRAGVADVTLHDLRALAGTDAKRQGLDPTALLGHTSARTTASYLRDRSPAVVSGPRKKRPAN